MKKTFIKLVLLPAFAFFTGCGTSAPPVENISEIALRAQTGLLGSAYTVSFTGDGTARCECTFYRLEENDKPNLDFVENICTDLYLKNESAFVKQKDSSGDLRLVGIFTGRIGKPQFDDLARTVRRSEFFSIVDTKSDDAVSDAPPNFVRVVYEGKTKEVSGANNDLSKIEGAIIKTAKETNWGKEQQ